MTDSKTRKSLSKCEIVSVGKRRDGGTRYWCLAHKADATAKYGKRARRCRASHLSPIKAPDVLRLDLDQYQGGIALWGAVPAVYDTTKLPMDRGIHVHARPVKGGKKEMDCTVRAVRLVGGGLSVQGVLVSELDAIYYMVSSIFGYPMGHVECSYCGYAHLDKDWFSVHPHRRHLCSGCGRHFTDTKIAIGNPICGVRDACGMQVHKSKLSKRVLRIRQKDFGGGIQIWGSNPAFIWTSRLAEEEGIHVHAYGEDVHPKLDETYGQVVIDGVRLSPSMVRMLMAQRALPSLKGRIQSIDCPFCHQAHFSRGELAFAPVVEHRCRGCHRVFSSRGRLRKTVANPLPRVLERLALKAPRPPQQHDLGLLSETL